MPAYLRVLHQCIKGVFLRTVRFLAMKPVPFMQSTATLPAVTLPEVHRTCIAVALLFIANGMRFASWVSRIPAVRAPLGLSEG